MCRRFDLNSFEELGLCGTRHILGLSNEWKRCTCLPRPNDIGTETGTTINKNELLEDTPLVLILAQMSDS